MQRLRYSEIQPIPGAGVYAFSIDDPTALPPLYVGPTGLLYVGMTESSLEIRNHFFHKDSSFSSFRRSLGALLKQDLKLQAIRRGWGKSPKDMTHYRFAHPGEDELTTWMKNHLEYSYEVVSSYPPARERELISDLGPPLNLTLWPNPQKTLLMKLRKACRDEAAKS
jgi:hypothetical protein